MIPSFEKIVKSFAIDTSGVMLILLVSIPLSDPVYLRPILIGAGFIGFYFFPYLLSIGQTFGKRVEKIKVVDLSGADARLWRVLLRQLVFLIFSIGTFGIYLIVAFFTLSEKRENRMPHDYIFRTKLVDINPPNRDRGSDGFDKTDSMRKRGL